MNVNRIGAAAPAYGSVNQPGADSYEPTADATDFAAFIKKLAGPEMLWKEQDAEVSVSQAERDYTGVMGNLMTVRENKC